MNRSYAPQVLVAAVGNVFRADEGFGAEVIRRLKEHVLPDSVYVHDFDNGRLDLLAEEAQGYDTLILIDTQRRGGAPGTLSQFESNSGPVQRIVLVCEPACTDSFQMGLSLPVERAVERAVQSVLALLESAVAPRG